MKLLSSRSSARLVGAIVATVLVAALGVPALAQDNDACMRCHQDEELIVEKGDEEISGQIDADLFGSTVHGRLDCVSCHLDLEDADLPHADDLEPVNCAECHPKQGVQHAASRHGQAASEGVPDTPTCSACHGKHDIRRHTEPESRTAVMNIPRLCGTCHHEGTPVSINHDIPQERIFENYSQSLHGKGLYEKGLVVTATCISCHTSHEIRPHTDPASSINRNNIAATCTQCHAQIEEVHRKVINGKLWEERPHAIPACSECHSPHEKPPAYPIGMANHDCLRCHGQRDLTVEREGKQVSLYVNSDAYSNSMHEGVACAQCHTDVTSSLIRPCETVQGKVDCSVCHAEVVEHYEVSAHGTLAAKGDLDAPACLNCHDQHATQGKADPRSPTYPSNVPALCGQCHGKGERAASRIPAAAGDIVGSYEKSVHGRGLKESGLVVTATCASCHGAHDSMPPGDPRSRVHPDNVATTCGECHHGIEEEFRTSVHGSHANAGSDRPLPSCRDCHSSHSISRTDIGDFRFQVTKQCGQCHEEQSETFFETVHGKVAQLGLDKGAKCHDCHGTHGIQRVSNVNSTLHPTNVVETCGKCHEGAHSQFTTYLTHATHHDRESYPWLFWTFWGMTSLLVGTMVAAFTHTALWLFRLWRTREEWRPHRAAALAQAKDAKLYRRFNRYQRTQHLVMLLSFFTLALTGMALKFSYMGWAQGFAHVLGGFGVTKVLHRMAAIALICVFAAHLISVARVRRETGRSWWQMIFGPDTIMLGFRDIVQAYHNVKWFVGLGPRPKYGRWNYWERFDYFAVFWGVAVIGSTGFVLWFPEAATLVLPGWTVNVANIIHSDEALLAVGFIFTIHFFNTHFRPDKFPMDPVIFTGRMTLDELKHDKPGEYEQMVERGQLEEHLVPPLPKNVERTMRVFGMFALTVGVVLIALIAYSLLVG